MFYLFLILTPHCFFFSLSCLPWVCPVSWFALLLVFCLLAWTQSSVLNVQFSEVRVDSNHLEKDKKYKLCSWGTSGNREERMGLWGAWLSSAALHSISQNTMANKVEAHERIAHRYWNSTSSHLLAKETHCIPQVAGMLAPAKYFLALVLPACQLEVSLTNVFKEPHLCLWLCE